MRVLGRDLAVAEGVGGNEEREEMERINISS